MLKSMVVGACQSILRTWKLHGLNSGFCITKLVLPNYKIISLRTQFYMNHASEFN